MWLAIGLAAAAAFLAACGIGAAEVRGAMVPQLTLHFGDSASTAAAEAALVAVLGSAAIQPKILEAMRRPAEKVKPWHEYRQIFVTDKRIDAGVAFWAEQAERIAVELATMEAVNRLSPARTEPLKSGPGFPVEKYRSPSSGSTAGVCQTEPPPCVHTSLSWGQVS